MTGQILNIHYFLVHIHYVRQAHREGGSRGFGRINPPSGHAGQNNIMHYNSFTNSTVSL